MLDIGFYMRFHELIKSLDENKEYTSDEMYEKLEAIRSKEPVVYNIETTNRCNMRCKMCPRTTMMTRGNENQLAVPPGNHLPSCRSTPWEFPAHFLLRQRSGSGRCSPGRIGDSIPPPVRFQTEPLPGCPHNGP